MNGLSWPHAAKLSVLEGDTVRMRWINTTDRLHPIHLHGFYFRVDAKGDIARDTIYAVPQQRLAVTELMAAGQTMSVSWVPDRPGNWLMHCHMALHMSPTLRHGARTAHADNHALGMMSGLVTGWRVLPRTTTAKASSPARDARRIRLLAQSAPNRYGSDPGLGFVIQNGSIAPRADSVVIPGAPLILTRGEPVLITVVNRLREPTSVHWHGIELDSYFDGVSGWSGDAGRVAPQVQPNDSFTVSFTPPRSGTFIYHSHFSEEKQLSSGLYGPLLVLEPGARYDPQSDLNWVISQNGPGKSIRAMINGSTEPVLDLRAGHRYRIRVINISPNVPLTLSVLAESTPVRWRAIAKDGADLPPAQARVLPALLRIGVGETYDFEYTPAAPGDLILRAVDPGGLQRLAGTVRVR